MTHSETWLAIIDGEHARIVRHDGRGFHTVQTGRPDTAGQRAAGLASDRPGGRFEGAGVLRHAITPRSDPHTREKRHSAARIAAEINSAAAQGRFAGLILAGPSRTLRAVEEALDPGARRKIAGRLATGLMKVPDPDLGARFPAWPSLPGCRFS